MQLKDSPRIMVKLGGSLCDPQYLTSIVKAVVNLSGRFNIIIVPGGGPFADMVRIQSSRHILTDSAAHWMAIAGMDQYGLLLESLGMGLTASEPEAALELMSKNRPVVYLPYFFLRKTDPLPHSWDVTSDSISAYLATFFNVSALVLFKPVDGVPAGNSRAGNRILPSCSAHRAVHSNVVDGYFDQCLGKQTNCWVINGLYPNRLRSLLDGSPAVGTRILPDPEHRRNRQTGRC